jgi:magnesium transporter
VWDALDVQRDTINALHETNASLIDFRINEIMKTLTIFSVVIFPITLLAAIFGMNTSNMPFVDSAHGFWIIIGIMVASVLGMLTFFKAKKWF